MVKYLIDNWANPTLKTKINKKDEKDGKTCLDLATNDEV